MNEVKLMGKLTQYCGMKYTNSGKAVFTGSIMVKNNRSKSTFVKIKAWESLAETLNAIKLEEDEPIVTLIGYIDTNNYEDKSGKKIYQTEVVVEKIKNINSTNGVFIERTDDEYLKDRRGLLVDELKEAMFAPDDIPF
jgi:single-strand DNA-binding protein